MGPPRPILVAALLAALATTSCLRDYGEAPFACATSQACPEGYRCVAKVCRREGSAKTPDARAGLELFVKPADLGGRDLPPTPDQKIYQKDVDRFPDLPQGLTCAQVMKCYQGCKVNDSLCFDKCYDSGSPAAKVKLNAIEACDEKAFNGTCYADCHPYDEYYCESCISKVCAPQINACYL